MASIGHLAVGAAVGALYSRQTGSNPRASIAAFAALALAPDLDLVTGLLGVPPDTPLAHRGISHSLAAAFGLGAMLALLVRGDLVRRLIPGVFCFLALASHGLLDTMSERGGGPMLLWPISSAGFEFVWRPIPGVETAAHYLTFDAIPTLMVELVLFSPFIAYALITAFPKRVEKGPAEDAIT
jgi:inner membrane protein